MGNFPSQITHQHQNTSILSYQTEHDLRVLEWRSNPIVNEFIPKVFFQYQQNKKQKTFLSQCKTNDNLPIDVKFEKYIGNLTLLNGKLRFQECLYVLKCLLAGYQVILSFFSKAIVDPIFCFVTKEGEVKAWINDDYRKNVLQTQAAKPPKTVTSKDQLFLKSQDWIDKHQKTSSQANLIQQILLLVSELTNEQNKYQKFLDDVDGFITENILKNYNFVKISKFINKYIYQKTLFVKSNLLQAISRIYDGIHNPNNTIQNQSKASNNQNVVRNLSRMSMVTQNLQYEVGKTNEINLKKFTSGRDFSERNSTINRPHDTKKSTFFSSTAHSSTNSRFNSMAQTNNYENFNDHIQGSLYSSHLQPCSKVQIKNNIDKNHISPQFSFNCVLATNKSPTTQSIAGSLNTKSSFTSNKNQFRKPNIQIKIDGNKLKIIQQKKQIMLEDKNQTKLKKSISFLSPSIHVLERNIGRINSSPYKSLKSPIKNYHSIQNNKSSGISIGQSLQANYFTSKQNIKLFKSNCFDNECQNRKRQNYYTQINEEKQVNRKSIDQKSEANANIFTMKTITKLIPSNESISNQHESEGQFPSNQNISDYSGILASMGRSVEIIQVPEAQKLNFKGNKKLKTMLFSNPASYNQVTFMSAVRFQSQ